MVTVGRFFISQASIVRLRGIEWASSGPLSGTHSACGFIARSEGTSPGEPGRKLNPLVCALSAHHNVHIGAAADDLASGSSSIEDIILLFPVFDTFCSLSGLGINRHVIWLGPADC